MIEAARFPEYFNAVHGVEPFPWQRRLLAAVLEGAWPETISLPTGAGKTAILDVSLFALACGAVVPRRTVLVVDRRIVVDDAYRRARKIRAAVEEGTSRAGILGDMASALKELGGDRPLDVALLRGGMPREDVWARDPAQPLFVCSTVDQVGSRLLHQGYGVSPHMRSIHAGLLANDTLIVLDEAHCSEAFRQTLGWIAKYRSLAEVSVARPFAVVTMTATPREDGKVFRLNSDDRSDPALKRRLAAKKTLEFRAAPKPKEDGTAEEILGILKQLCVLPGKTILVVVNRVATARAIAESLAAAKSALRNPLAIEAPLLLTGRSRPLDRDALLASATDRLLCGRDRKSVSNERSLVVVATQCVEVGADIDADVLVTEACPLDALRQRLGRLDRLGELGESNAWIVAPKTVATAISGTPVDDPVYGDSARLAWEWLLKKSMHGKLEAGTDSFAGLVDGLAKDELASMCTSAPDAPLMFPAYCDLWIQTSPEPAVVPEPALFLHGPDRGDAELRLVWRSDLDVEHPEHWAAIVSACPPVVGEALPVPFWQARKWLSGNAEDATGGSDLEGDPLPADRPSKQEDMAFKPILRWKGEETESANTDLTSLRPGDTIVLSATSGGCDAWGWVPHSRSLVTDVADQARRLARTCPVLRLHSSLIAGWPEELHALFAALDDDEAERVAIARKAVSEARKSEDLPEWRDAMLATLSAKRGGLEVEPYPDGSGWTISCARRMPAVNIDDSAGGGSSEDDTASRLSTEVTLEDHLSHVESRIITLTSRLGLDDSIASDLGLAARFHDVGKADPRFQALLRGGNRLLALRSDLLLAKSPRMPASAEAHKAAAGESGYPQGSRHEVLSMRMAENSREALSSANDSDLVLHLISSHHGRCRPFAPTVVDPSPRVVRCDIQGLGLSARSDGEVEGIPPWHAASGVSRRFWRLVRRYGWWGLSYLEACLRLSDHRASEDEEKEEQK